jgi:hypothetical protein
VKTRSVLAAAAGALAIAAPAALAGPAPTVVTSATGTCAVGKVVGLASATSVSISGTQLAAPFLSMTGCQAPYAIVKRIGATGVQRPFVAQGFRCTPSISGSTGRWTCLFQAADTDAQITMRFTTRYAG